MAQDKDSKTREAQADRRPEDPGARPDGDKVRNGPFFRTKISGREDD